MVADVRDGYFKPAGIDKNGDIVACGADAGVKAAYSEEEFAAAAIRKYSDAKDARPAGAAAKVSPGEIKRTFPTTGTVRGLIVLAEFEDVKFQPGSTREYFNEKVNGVNYSAAETYGSVNDYFKEQSGGLFTPEFDIVGPVTLPHERSWYGLEEKLDDLFRDAAKKAKEQYDTDFTRYDVNDDYFVDFFFVVFAGHGEAQGGGAETIWPAMKDLSYYVFDTFDGMSLSVAACSAELKGGSGATLDGVGTICHEFSHILGLPDIYDAMSTGGYGMGHYDMLCYGPYNDDGRTPCSYTAMEKYTLGWIEPKVLEDPQAGVELRNFNTTNDCYFIVNPDNVNEYYTLENRQQEGFDSGLPGHGLVISYVHYDRSKWAKNTVNSPSLSLYEHVSLIAADNILKMDPENEAGDTWPGTKGKTEFTDGTQPSAVWRSSGKPVGKPVTNIRESADGTVTFDFNTTASLSIPGSDPDGSRVSYYNLQGMPVSASSMASGVYIMRGADGKTTKISVR